VVKMLKIVNLNLSDYLDAVNQYFGLAFLSYFLTFIVVL